MAYQVSWPQDGGTKHQIFNTKADALKAVRALKGVRIRPSKMHRGIVYYMTPIGQVALTNVQNRA
jgi:hypothetical protein